MPTGTVHPSLGVWQGRESWDWTGFCVNSDEPDTSQASSTSKYIVMGKVAQYLRDTENTGWECQGSDDVI